LRADEKTAMFAAEGMDPEKVPAVERAVSGCPKETGKLNELHTSSE
jgi:hypothetical protein